MSGCFTKRVAYRRGGSLFSQVRDSRTLGGRFLQVRGMITLARVLSHRSSSRADHGKGRRFVRLLFHGELGHTVAISLGCTTILTMLIMKAFCTTGLCLSRRFKGDCAVIATPGKRHMGVRLPSKAVT